MSSTSNKNRYIEKITGSFRPRRWGEKPYYSLDYYLKQTFGEKVYKLALDGGMTCPNRDGTLGTGGCIFCSEGGSGEFAAAHRGSVTEQIEQAKLRVSRKITSGRYIAYFQSYTNTYAPLPYLESLFTEAISHPDIAVLSVATRPDCLPPETVSLLARLNRMKPVWVELGLQTIHESTARAIGRGYELSCFLDAVKRLKEAGLTVVVHVILGLPGESRAEMLDTVRFLGNMTLEGEVASDAMADGAARPDATADGAAGGSAAPGAIPAIDGIKLQLLHLLKGTRLARLYETEPFPILTLEEYTGLILDCVRLLPPNIVIHRISGDGPKSLLLEPAWSGNKRLVLNTITKAFRETGAYQGEWLNERNPYYL